MPHVINYLQPISKASRAQRGLAGCRTSGLVKEAEMRGIKRVQELHHRLLKLILGGCGFNRRPMQLHTLQPLFGKQLRLVELLLQAQYDTVEYLTFCIHRYCSRRR